MSAFNILVPKSLARRPTADAHTHAAAPLRPGEPGLAAMHATMIPRERGRIVSSYRWWETTVTPSLTGALRFVRPWPAYPSRRKEARTISARHALLADEILGQNVRTAYDYSKLTCTRRTYLL